MTSTALTTTNPAEQARLDSSQPPFPELLSPAWDTLVDTHAKIQAAAVQDAIQSHDEQIRLENDRLKYHFATSEDVSGAQPLFTHGDGHQAAAPRMPLGFGPAVNRAPQT